MRSPARRRFGRKPSNTTHERLEWPARQIKTSRNLKRESGIACERATSFRGKSTNVAFRRAPIQRANRDHYPRLVDRLGYVPGRHRARGGPLVLLQGTARG